VGTDNPAINAKRVALRVMEGGRDVPIRKIISRYTRSLANCTVAGTIADRAYICDNSTENTSARLLFRSIDGKMTKHYGDINPWALEILRQIDPTFLSKDGIASD
jgi:predicted ABC-type ATPase